MNKSINRSINSGAPRGKRASGAPWVNKSTHPRKSGNYVTERPSDRPSVRTTGIPMFTLTLSSYFGSPGESWLHINVVVNWQLSKQGIRWPYRGLRCWPIKVEYFFWSYPFSNDRRLRFTFFLNSYQICCVYVRIAPHYYDFDFKLTSDAKIRPFFFKIQAGKTFSYHSQPFINIACRSTRQNA